jgi:redox-sensing transcriptional repressor
MSQNRSGSTFGSAGGQRGDSGAAGRGTPVPDFPDLPEATVARLPEYLRALHHFAEEGLETVSSDALATAAGVNSAKLRKDLSHLGSYGTRGVGYEVNLLVNQIESVLGLTQRRSVKRSTVWSSATSTILI